MNFPRLSPGIAAAAAAVANFAAIDAVRADRFLVFVGTYTGEHSKGIYSYRFDTASGVIEELGLAAETPNPTFLALHPNGKFLYAANEIAGFRGKPGGSVTAYRIDAATGRLVQLNQASTGGDGPCHLMVDPSGRQVLAANYGGGSVCSLPVHDDGTVGEPGMFIQHHGSSVNPDRQKEPHAHSVNLSPDGRFAFVADLGIDQIRVYGFTPDKGLSAADTGLSVRTTPGAGPRHFTFSPDGRFAYVCNEMASSVTVYAYDAGHGRLQPLQTLSTLPVGADARGNSTAEVRTSPDGRFVYVSNRGNNSLAIFAIAPGRGTLTAVGHAPTLGRTPRNFCFDPTGAYVFAANQDTDNIFVLRADRATGQLQPAGQELKVGRPVCVRFLRVP